MAFVFVRAVPGSHASRATCVELRGKPLPAQCDLSANGNSLWSLDTVVTSSLPDTCGFVVGSIPCVGVFGAFGMVA
jgi:hypothetical protein